MRVSFGKTLLAVLAIGFLVAVFASINTSEHPFDDRAFSKAGWANAEPLGRALMIDDMRTQVLGSSKSEVSGLLGRPDEELNSNQYSPKSGVRGGDVFSYYIGEWPSAGFNHAFVCVFFDINGISVEVTIEGS